LLLLSTGFLESYGIIFFGASKGEQRVRIGALVHWFIGSLVHWCIGSLVHWCIGALVHTCIGAYVHTCIGALVIQVNASSK
jgi:hypothetical protein